MCLLFFLSQTESQISKNKSLAEQDGTLWADYEASKTAASALAKLRKELDSVTQMDVSTEQNLDSAIQQLTVGWLVGYNGLKFCR